MGLARHPKADCPLLRLPHEVIALILRCLCIRDLAAVEATCKALGAAAHCPSIWTEIVLPRSIGRAPLPPKLRKRLAHCQSLRLTPPRLRRCSAKFSARPEATDPQCCGGVLDEHVEQILQCCPPSMTELDLSGHTHLTAASLWALINHSPQTLQKLWRRGCSNITTGWDAEVTKYEAFPDLPRLRLLELSHTNSNDRIVDSFLGKSPRLDELLLNFLPDISDLALTRLQCSQRVGSRFRLGVIGSSRISDQVLRSLMKWMPPSHLLCDISYICNFGAARNCVPQPCGDATSALNALIAAYHLEESM